MKNLLIILIFCTMIILLSCKDDENNPTEPQPNNQEVIIPLTTKTIDSTKYSSNLISISNDSSTYTFKNSFATEYNPKIDDILVVTKPPGMLRKVKNIQTSGDEIIISTQQATLTEAIEKGKISFRESIQKMQIQKVERFYDGISYKLNKGENANYDFNIDVVLYDVDGNTSTTNDQVKLEGNFILTADIIFEVDIESYTLQRAKIGLDANNSETLNLIASLNYELEKEITLATVHLSPIYIQLGPLPVVIVNTINITAGLNGYANASVTAGIENSVEYEAGIEFTNGQGWAPYSTITNQFNYNGPTLSANAGARIYVKPELSLAVYGVLAGYCNAEVYGEIEADITADPWWELYAGLDFNVGAKAKIYSVNIFDYETTVMSFKWPIAQATGSPNLPPSEPSNPMPINNGTNVLPNSILSWECSDPDGDPITYDVYFGTSQNPPLAASGHTQKTYDPGLLNVNTNYYWKTVAKDDQGNEKSGPAWMFSTVENSSFEITLPSSSTIWTQGDNNVSITWNDGNLSGNVKIELYKSNNFSETITSSTANNGNYSNWDVPENITVGNDYTVKITSLTNNDFDFSEEFEIKQKVSTPGLIAYYPFNGNANDESGNNNHGQVNGATLTIDRFGNSNSSYDFDGDDDFIELTNDVDETEYFTISAWVKLNSYNPIPYHTTYGGNIIFTRGNLLDSGQWDYIFNVNGNHKLSFTEHISSIGAATTEANDIFPLEQWVHVVYVNRGGEGYLFQNANQVGFSSEMSGGNYNQKSPTVIGILYRADLGYTTEEWDGIIDDIRIYNRALTNQEISDLYNN